MYADKGAEYYMGSEPAISWEAARDKCKVDIAKMRTRYKKSITEEKILVGARWRSSLGSELCSSEVPDGYISRSG